MRKKQLLAAFFLPLLLASFLQSQSLADLAKKEKERRAAVKGKGTVITSADISKVKKRPAVVTQAEQTTTEGEVQAGEAAAGAEEQVAPPAAAGQTAAQAGEAAPPAEPTPDEKAAQAEKDSRKRLAELTEQAQQKAEMVELLTIKMNALYQEFHGLDNVKSRELIQLQISDTYDKLLKAEADSAKAQKDLEEFLALAKKTSVPEIWIK